MSIQYPSDSYLFSWRMREWLLKKQRRKKRVILPLRWSIIRSISPSPGKSLASVPGTGAGRRRKQCLEFVKNLSHPHMSTYGSAPPPLPIRMLPSGSPHKLCYPASKLVNVTCPNKLLLLLAGTYNLFISLVDTLHRSNCQSFYLVGAVWKVSKT